MERRDNYVLAQMVKMGYITQQQMDETKAAGPPKIVGKRTPEGCAQVQRPELNAGFFCDYLVRWWSTQEKVRCRRLRAAEQAALGRLQDHQLAGHPGPVRRHAQHQRGDGERSRRTRR
jgi:hypothetical protein